MLQAWQEAGLSTADVQGVLEAIPALPSGMQDDYEAALILARDPDFQKYKNDPDYIQRLRSNLASIEPSYAPGLPPSSNAQTPEFSFPPNFPGWDNHANEPFYSMDQRELGRYLAIMGGEGT